MKRYVKQAFWIGVGGYAAALLAVAVLAQEPIEGLRVPLAFNPDGTLKSELTAQRAMVRSDATIAASGVVFRVFSTNGTVETTITADNAQFSSEKQVGRSETSVSLRQGEVLLTGEGFEWDGKRGTLRILQKARISFPAEMIKMGGVSNNDKQKQ